MSRDTVGMVCRACGRVVWSCPAAGYRDGMTHGDRIAAYRRHRERYGCWERAKGLIHAWDMLDLDGEGAGRVERA